MCHSRSLYDDERDNTEFHNTTSDLQDQDEDRYFFWSQTGLVLRPTVLDHITGQQLINLLVANCYKLLIGTATWGIALKLKL